MKKTNLAIGIGLSMALLSVMSVVKSQEGKGDLVEVTPFPSRYMDANQPMFELEMGARVAKDTYDYWNLPTDSPQRTSYDHSEFINIADGVWTYGSSSLVNIHIVEAPEGLIIYDTGTSREFGEHFYRQMRQHLPEAPVKAIIYSHDHYVFGTEPIIEKEQERGNEDILVIGPKGVTRALLESPGTATKFPEIAGVLLSRTLEQFNVFKPSEGPDAGFKNTMNASLGGLVLPNYEVEHGEVKNIGGMDVKFFTQDIDTDSQYQIVAWFPEKRIAMNNIIWGWFPNLYSLRGGDFRNPTLWKNAVDTLIELEPEVLLSTHSTSLVGDTVIMERLEHYKDGIASILDQSLKAILQGSTPAEMSYEVQLPENLKDAPILIENYGEIAHVPGRIYTALFGQFNRNAAQLNRLHPTEEAQRLVNAMGGLSATYTLAKTAHNDGDFLWACQLADYLVTVEDSLQHRQLKANCLREMGHRALAQNVRSWHLSQARALEGKTAIPTALPAFPDIITKSPTSFVDQYRIRISPQKANDFNQVLVFEIDDETPVALHIRNGVAHFVDSVELDEGQVRVSMTADTWVGVFNNLIEPQLQLNRDKSKLSKVV
ncbi:alkyl sulfatase [Vibrio maritimus]|uniref:Alkyl sulfatase n=1 Tax=Vibrio maritimus TaxID=990268 RepID=A0A090SGV1_9VIBR|nr:alkyl sulfatase [Vibrio maritimus]